VLEGNRNRQAKHNPKRKPDRQSESAKKLVASKRKRCSKKKKYDSKEQAEAHCNQMLARVTLQLTPLEPYYCHRHQAWHVGHNWLKYNHDRRTRW